MGCTPTKTCVVVVQLPNRPPSRANIRIDPGVDEISLASCEDGYPVPEPPLQTKMKADVFFNDKKYQTVSDFADLFDTDLEDDDVSVNQLDLEVLAVAPRTRQRPPTSMGIMSFEEVDAHASKAGGQQLSSMEDLMKYLKELSQHDRCRQIMTARAIVTWLSQQDIESNDYGVANDRTPKGLLQYLKEGRMTYAACYTRLCRAAGLQCALIEGFVKASYYEPGDADVPLTKWVAVYGEYGWQIVHPFWVCRAMFGQNMAGWVKAEDDGTLTNVQEGQSDGIVRRAFQERYFMPKPDEFLYECCAKDPEWQLVQPEKRIMSMNEFLAAPYLLPPIHSVGLQLVSQRSSVLHSKEGFCKVEFKGRTTDAHMLLLRYELFKKNMDRTTIDKFWVSRMVFNSRSNENFIFDIRFPVCGVYKLVIYGGPSKLAALRLCEFRIDCDQEMKGHNLLPLACSKIGWGPGPDAIAAGLLMPTKPSGLIAVESSGQQQQLETIIKFRIRDDFFGRHEYSAELHAIREGATGQIVGTDFIERSVEESEEMAVSLSNDGLQSSNRVNGRRRNACGQIAGSGFIARRGQVSETEDVSLSITTELELVVRVKLPCNEGEFGISIREREANKEYKEGEVKTSTVCNYLVMTRVNNGPRIPTEVMLAKGKLLKVCTEIVEPKDLHKKIVGIEQEIINCKKVKIADDDEDICAAETTREYLTCKRLLRECLQRRNYRNTLRTLDIMSRYKYEFAFRKQIERVKKMQIELLEDEKRRREQSE